MLDNTRDWARKQLAPFTVGLSVVLVLTSLVFWFSTGRGMQSFVFPVDWVRQPWSLLTYPFAYVGVGDIGQLLWFLLLIAWLFMAGASLERQIGTPRYAVLWFAMTALPALILWAGMLLTGRGIVIHGPYLPVAAISVIWATRNQNAAVSLMGILPLTGKWIGWIVVAGTFFNYGGGNPILGVFAILHLAIAYAYADNKIPFLQFSRPVSNHHKPSKEQIERENAYFDEVRRREKERDERERLRKLFEGSLNDDDPR